MRTNVSFIKNIIAILLFSTISISCDEEPVGQTPIDNIAPGKVKVNSVASLNGATKIFFTPPKDEDLLYIKALYLVNGLERETRVSLYERELLLEGFSDTVETKVEIFAVDRSKNSSEAVQTTVKPLKLPVNIVGESISVSADFGGARITFQNPTKAEVAIICYVNDTLSGEMVQYDQYYTSKAEGWHSFRGLDAIERKIQIRVRDRWSNYSKITEKVLTPYFEEYLDNSKMSCIGLASDEPVDGSIYGNSSKMFDGSFSSKYQTNVAKIWPVFFTVDLGSRATLSRFKVFQWENGTSYGFARLNVAEFELWGWNGDTYPVDDWEDPNWSYMGVFVTPKPSGLPYGQQSAEDKEALKAGAEHIPVFGSPSCRYLRFKITETYNSSTKFGGNGADGKRFFIAQLQFWGDKE